MITLKNERLINIMIQRGFSQRQLARKAKLSNASLSLWLSGERNPKASSVKALAKALDVCVSDISNIQLIYNKTDAEVFNKELEKLNTYWSWLSKEQRQNLMAVIKEMALANRRKEEEDTQGL